MKGRVLKMAQALVHDPGPKGELFRTLLVRIHSIIQDMDEFTTDDLREFLSINQILQDLGDPRLLGIAIRWLEHRGLIRKTDRFVPTRRAEAHARPIRVYKVVGGSLVLPYNVKTPILEKYRKLDAAKLGVIPLDEF